MERIKHWTLDWPQRTIPVVILEESFLSFLGLGVQAPAASLGSLISEGAQYLNPFQIQWWLVLFPAGTMAMLFWCSIWSGMGSGMRLIRGRKSKGEARVFCSFEDSNSSKAAQIIKIIRQNTFIDVSYSCKCIPHLGDKIENRFWNSFGTTRWWPSRNQFGMGPPWKGALGLSLRNSVLSPWSRRCSAGGIY